MTHELTEAEHAVIVAVRKAKLASDALDAVRKATEADLRSDSVSRRAKANAAEDDAERRARNAMELAHAALQVAVWGFHL